MSKVAIGIDIGGTSIKLGLVTGQGRLIEKTSFPTDKKGGREKTLRELERQVKAFAAKARSAGHQVAGVGIGAPGPVDVDRGFVYFFPNVPGWKDTPLVSILSKRLRMPVRLDNDANAMALGEFLFGAGRGVKNGIALTLGTGVGGGIILDGKLFHGPTYSAAEIGHLVINEDGPKCGCGNTGCIETYVGNGYFTREIERRLAKGEKSVLSAWIKEGKTLTPLLAKEAWKKGDRFAKKMWADTGTHLGNALVGLVNILNPEKIILGGGIAQNPEILFPHVIETIRKKAFPIAFRSLKVVPARLGTEAGLIGAAALVFANSEGKRT